MKKKIATDTHQFALFSEHSSGLFVPNKIGARSELIDAQLVHRIVRVLRLDVGETCIIFDRKYHAIVRIEQIDKKKVVVVAEQVNNNRTFVPEITCYVPVLKRDALEQALYACVELGATHIALVKTQKVHRVYSDKELDHARACMIAAAEQSKNFAFPELDSLISLEKVVNTACKPLIFCDPTGKPLLEVLNTLQQEKPAHIGIMIGPEGDLTGEEKEMLVKQGAIFCALTPTVLRAQDALTIALGSIRSI